MSRTTICVTDREGEVHHGREFPNAWRSAPFIWRALWRTYIAPTDESYPPAMERMDALWALDRDPRLPREERITLVTTFDWVMIRREDCHAVADAYDAFAARYERRKGERGLTSLPLQALYLRDLAGCPAIREVCWIQTSSAGGLWTVPDPETERRQYNVLRDTQHWFLFERYPELRPGLNRVTR